MTVNQELVPEGFVHYSLAWQVLGTFTVTGNSLVVKLGNNANDVVIADGIHIQRLESPQPNLATELTYDPLDNLIIRTDLGLRWPALIGHVRKVKG